MMHACSTRTGPTVEGHREGSRHNPEDVQGLLGVGTHSIWVGKDGPWSFVGRRAIKLVHRSTRDEGLLTRTLPISAEKLLRPLEEARFLQVDVVVAETGKLFQLFTLIPG